MQLGQGACAEPGYRLWGSHQRQAEARNHAPARTAAVPGLSALEPGLAEMTSLAPRIREATFFHARGVIYATEQRRHFSVVTDDTEGVYRYRATIVRKRRDRRKRAVTATPSQTVTVRSLLVGWANEQDAWVRHLVSEVVVSGRAMTESQLDAIYQTFLREKALTTGDPVNVPKNLSENAQASLRTIRWIMAILIQASLVRGLIS